jgi:AraC-like DNA-binding protein
MDALISLLDRLNLRARLVYTGGVCGPWGIDHNSERDIWFHLVSRGSGWLHGTAWAQPLRVDEGDLVLFLPHAAKHYLSYSADELCFDAPGAAKVPLAQGSTGFVCGLIELVLPQALLWRSLPAELVIRRREAGDALSRLLALILDEARLERFGSLPLVERLCDALLLLVLRHGVEQGLIARGPFDALRDPRLQRVLSAMHAEPGRRWTVQALAAQAQWSRSVLAERFAAQVGCPPMEYLAQLRLQQAAACLRDTALPLEQVAERCGYESTSAFSRAYKRALGLAPGQWRRRHTGARRAQDPQR